MESSGGVLNLNATFEEIIVNSDTYGKTYKETSESNNIDSHMMKNSEWGAVAILSNSRYGSGIGGVKYDNTNVTGGPLNTSTTGTAYGIFGMHGGPTAVREFVAGTFNGADKGWLWYMYYIYYANLRYRDMSLITSGGGIAGDAMDETKNITGGGGIGLRNYYPIVQRGNLGILSYGVASGTGGSSYGSASAYIGSRATIVCGTGI